VQRYVGQLEGAYGTRSNQFKPVRVLFRCAVVEGIVKVNPAREIVVPQAQKIQEDDDENTRAFSRQELTVVLGLVPARHGPLFNLLATTGLRISEALGLRWRDLVLEGERPAVKVRRAWVRGRWHAPKSKHGRREIALPQDLVFQLRGARGADPEALLFPSAAGTPMHARNLRARVLDPVCEEAGVSWAGFHTFRHTYASMMIANSVPLVPLSRALGHHSPVFTLSVYTHLLDGDEAPALDLATVTTAVTTQPAEPHRNDDPAELPESAA